MQPVAGQPRRHRSRDPGSLFRVNARESSRTIPAVVQLLASELESAFAIVRAWRQDTVAINRSSYRCP
jgi:hypothetical protein